MHYGWSKFEKDFKAKGAGRNIYYTQFGGASTDEIHDVKVLSTGEIIAFGRTKSTTFCGMDISAYTNGTYYAWFMLKIDKEFYKKSGYSWLLGSYFITGNGKGCNTNGYSSRPANIEIDASDNIFYCYGSITAYTWPPPTNNDWKIYGVRSSDMTLQYTADTAITVCSNDDGVAQPYIYAQHKRYGTDWFVIYNDGYGGYLKCQKLDSSLAQTYDTQIVSALGSARWPLNAIVCSSGIFVYCENKSVVKASLLAAYDSAWVTGTAIEAQNGMCFDGTYVYLFPKYVDATKVFAIRQSDLALIVDTAIGPAAGKANLLMGASFDSDGRLWVSGYTNDGAIGTNDPKIYEIDPSDGSVISSKLLSYKSGVSIGTESVNTLNYVGPVDMLDGNKVWAIRLATGAKLNGYAALGDQDCGIFVTDENGNGLT